MNLRGQLAYNAEETYRLLSLMDLDALGNIGNGLGSQIIGRTENLGYCTRGSHPDLFSLVDPLIKCSNLCILVDN